ncbi:MoaD/ThiS family protein [Chloroflexota bacterium]
MSVKIVIPSYLQSQTDNVETAEVNGSTVGECLNHLIKQFPRMGKMLLDKNSKLFAYLNIYINGEDGYPDELAKPVKDGDELHILYMIGGG